MLEQLDEASYAPGMERLHWVIAEHDEHTACGELAERKARATDLQADAGHDTCSTCYTLWTRYAVRVGA